MLRVGTSGWSYDDWKGVLYPPDLPRRRWLEHFSCQFPTVELNNSFYRLPPRDQFERWAATVPDGFCFAVKVSRYLSHVKRLKEPAEPIERFLDRAGGLGDRFGPSLLQLPPNLRRDDGVLRDVLDRWPAGHRLAVEFRHETWFDDTVLALLAEHDVALCLTDRRNHRPEPLTATARWGYVRFHEGTAHPRPAYGDDALRSWADRLDELWGPRADVYVYFNNDPKGCAVRNARRFVALAERHRAAAPLA